MKLYDYVFNIINGKKNFDDFNDMEKSEFNPFMTNKVISMDYDLLPLAENTNRFVDSIPPKVLHDSLKSFIPNRRYNLTYKKGKKEDTEHFEETVGYIAKLYDVPVRDAKAYYHDLTEEQLKEVRAIYGVVDE